MEATRARGYRDDNPRLPTLSLGLSSVRLIVNQIEAEYARVVATRAPEISCEIVKYDPNFDEGYDDYDDFPFGPPRRRVWSRFAVKIGLALAKCIPSVTFENFGLLAVTTALFAPKMISYLVVYPFCRLVFGTLYPAYASYKAVRTKNLKEYVKWMMYWIVFALFTCTETFTDVFLSWFPFYYEVKIVLVLWLLSPATKGSSILYRKFVHPALCRREQEIDEYIAKAKDQGYHTVLNLGTKGVNYATTVIMQTAIKGGGGLVQQLRKSYSLSDLTECEPREDQASDEADDVLAEPRLIRRGPKSGPRRSASESNSRSPMYFPEVDVEVRGARTARTDEPDFSHIKSSEDISSGYSSADNSASLTRTASLGAAARARARATRTTVTTIKRPQAAEESEVIIEEPHDDDTFEYANMPPLVNALSPIFLSHSDPPFLYQYIEDQIKIIQVLGNLPLSIDSNKQPNNSDQPVQNAASDEISAKKENVGNLEDTAVQVTSEDNTILESAGTGSKNNIKVPTHMDISETVVTNAKNISTSIYIKETKTNEKEDNDFQVAQTTKIVEPLESTSVETSSLNDNDSVDSDDEASFGTPDDSPKPKRKSVKGKYGKAKAPPPPIEQPDVRETNDTILDNTISTTSLESLTDLVSQLPDNAFKDSGTLKILQVVNPIAEKKRRHKAKSPARLPKGQSSGIGKLLQLPSKLAFWQKSDDKSKSDALSISSEDHSRRSSTAERLYYDEFQSCTELSKIDNTEIISEVNIADDQISFKDATDLENEAISQDIIDKSDALEKLIAAKLESHPEYKYVPLHDEIPTTSKSTDV